MLASGLLYCTWTKLFNFSNFGPFQNRNAWVMVVLVETTICMENYQTSKNQISIYLKTTLT